MPRLLSAANAAACPLGHANAHEEQQLEVSDAYRYKLSIGYQRSTDGWGAYERHVAADTHTVGQDNTQKSESTHLNLRTRIKRLVRRTMCFSKTERMHDLVMGLFINRYECGVSV